MFLDPEPKGTKQQSTSTFLPAADNAVISLRDQRNSLRKPLHERSKSQNNIKLTPSRTPVKSTVRLVEPTPTPPVVVPPSSKRRSYAVEDNVTRDVPQDILARVAGLGLDLMRNESQGQIDLSDTSLSTIDASDLPDPSMASVYQSNTLSPASGARFHHRDVSSSAYSDASTLKGSELIYGGIGDTTGRYSLSTTLLGTPSFKEQPSFVDEINTSSLTTPPTMQVEFPSIQTIRTVPPSTSGSAVSSEPQSDSASNQAQMSRPPTSHSDSESAPAIPRRSSKRRTLSAGSALTKPHIPAPQPAFELPAPRPQKSQESISAQSDNTASLPSSPNFIAYSPSVSQRSATTPLHYTASFESISSRLQYPAVIPSRFAPNLASSSSWGSLQSSNATLPPLSVPRRRLRSRSTAESLRSQGDAAFTSGSVIQDDDDNTRMAYHRPTFSGNLSTIASESDRNDSQNLTYLSSDDHHSRPFSGTWPRSRFASANTMPVELPTDPLRRPITATSTDEEAGDMTLGIFREESAKPEPLFRISGAKLVDHVRKSLDPTVQLTDVSSAHAHESDEEDFDTLTALQSPPLRPKRSAYSVRQRSNSTPSHSRQRSNSTPSHSRQHSQTSHADSDRWSVTSSNLPTWAKHFYAGRMVLANKPSWASLSNTQVRPIVPPRLESNYPERVIAEHPPVLQPGNPLSQHPPTRAGFLPTIFHRRSRTDPRRFSLRSLRSTHTPRTLPDTESARPTTQPHIPELEDTSPPLSTAPTPTQLPFNPTRPLTALPSSISDSVPDLPLTLPASHRASAYFPNPPQLARTRRAEQSQRDSVANWLDPSAWRPPSFTESLSLVSGRGERQVLCFVLGFICPVAWWLGAMLPLPGREWEDGNVGVDVEKVVRGEIVAEGRDGWVGVEEVLREGRVRERVVAGEMERRWREERVWLKARWWRVVNRAMSLVGVLLIAAVIALAVVATK